MSKQRGIDVVSVDRIEPRILLIRAQRVMLDADLAELYGTTTKALNQAVKRKASSPPDRRKWALDYWIRRASSVAGACAFAFVNDFVKDFKNETGCELPTELGGIALSHQSARENPGYCGGFENGLTLLGNLAYCYVLCIEALRRREPQSLRGNDLGKALSNFVCSLGANQYKLRFARRWSKYIIAGNGVLRPFPESILVDTFEAMLGAAVLHDLSNLESIANLITTGVGADADFDQIVVTHEVLTKSLKLGGSLLQKIYQRFGPPGIRRLTDAARISSLGPHHSLTYSCSIKGDMSGELVGNGRTKTSALDQVFRHTVEHICRRVFSGTRSRCGVPWIESIILAMRDGLIENPDPSAWLSIPHRNDLFPIPDVLQVVGDAVRSPDKDSVALAIRGIENDRGLQPEQRASLTRFLSAFIGDRDSARALERVSAAYRGLLKAEGERAASDAVSVLCSCLYLLKCLRHNAWETVCCHDIVAGALAVGFGGAVASYCVPGRVVYIDWEKYRCLLKQLQVSEAFGEAAAVSEGESGTMTVSFQRRRSAPQHKLLLETAWAMSDDDTAGFVVRGTQAGCEFLMPLVDKVSVSAGCLSRVYVRGAAADGIEPRTLAEELSPQVERVLSALHEIKNRIIAYPGGWRDELRKYEGGLAEATEAMRAPQLVRTGCEALHRIVCEAAREADAAYGAKCRFDVMYDDDSAYCDEAMLATIFRNLASNASRAASEAADGLWGIDGTVTREEIDVTVFNACNDVASARAIIEGASARSTSRQGTGIGLPTIRRLVAKLVGRLDFQYTADQVRAHTFIPVDLNSAVCLLEGV